MRWHLGLFSEMSLFAEIKNMEQKRWQGTGDTSFLLLQENGVLERKRSLPSQTGSLISSFLSLPLLCSSSTAISSSSLVSLTSPQGLKVPALGWSCPLHEKRPALLAGNEGGERSSRVLGSVGGPTLSFCVASEKPPCSFSAPTCLL